MMSLEPTENSHLIGQFPTIDELRQVAHSNGVDTSISHATINDDYSRLLYPCKEKTEGRWPNCPFTMLFVQLDQCDEEDDAEGGFTAYANGEHCHGKKFVTGNKREIRLDSLAPGVEKITLDNESSDEEEQVLLTNQNDQQTSTRSKGKCRIVYPPRRLVRRRVAPSYNFHLSVDTKRDVNRVRTLDEQSKLNNSRFSWQQRFACRRSFKQGSGAAIRSGLFTDCPKRMLSVLEEDGSYSIYNKGEHNHPIDEHPRRVFRYRQLAAQYLSGSGNDVFSTSEPPHLLLTEIWRLKHHLTDQHKFLGTMDEAGCWAFLRLRRMVVSKTREIMAQAKCAHVCEQQGRTRCPYKLYTIPVEESEGKEFYIYEKGSHNDHVQKEASIKEESGVYLKSFPSWEEVDKYRLVKKVKIMNRHFSPNSGRLFYNCYTNGCNYSIKAVESTTPDGSIEIKLYELGEHQHKRRLAMDDPLPESVKKARLNNVDSAEWRTTYRIDHQFHYLSAMSQVEWKAHQKEHRITRNGILSFGGMKGGYYCSINPYSGCQYRMVAVRDELDEDRVHVLEKGEHSDHVTINAPRGQKVKKEIPIGAGYTHFRTLATLDEVAALAREMKTQPLLSSYGGKKRPYVCNRCSYLVTFIQHTEDGLWEGYEKGKHLHPVSE